MRTLNCHLVVEEEYNTSHVRFKMADNPPRSSDGYSQSKRRPGKKFKQISWLILAQICIEVFNVCYGSRILQKLENVTISHAAKLDVHICGQRNLVLLVLLNMSTNVDRGSWFRICILG